MKKIFLFVIVMFVATLSNAETVVNVESTKSNLLGEHDFFLSWIGREHMGKVTVTEKNSTLYIKGKQGYDGDYITINGIISSVDKTEFTFDGKIITKVHHMNEGNECIREGRMEFSYLPTWLYWRLDQFKNPCDKASPTGTADYINIFFTLNKYPLTVKSYPENAAIRILNIKPKYEPGMLLKEGHYHIEVKKEGYLTKNVWRKLQGNQQVFDLYLRKAE